MFWNAWRHDQDALLWLPSSPQTHQPSQRGTQYYFRDGDHFLATRTANWGSISEWRPIDEYPEALTEAIKWLLFPSDPIESPIPLFIHAWQLLYDVIWQDLPPAEGISGYLARELLLPPTLMPQEADRALEWALANLLRRQYSPNELLEWYLNRIQFDEVIAGVDAASLAYFGTTLTEINTKQSIQLAWQAVSQSHPTLLGEFQSLPTAMNQQGQISDEEALQLISAGPLNEITTHPIHDSTYSEFIELAHDQASTILQNYGYDAKNAFATGLTIITTLDWSQQQQVEQSISEILTIAESAGFDSGAFIAIDVKEGSITSMVGSARLENAPPAPVILPFLYLEGLRGQSNPPLHAATMLLDLPKTYPHPEINGLEINARNSDDEFLGPILFADALETLRAVPIYEAIGSDLGLANAIQIAGRLGWSSLVDETPNHTLLTQGGAVSVLDTAYTYTTLANRGVMHGLPAAMRQSSDRPHDPIAILEIIDAKGNSIWRYEMDDDRYSTSLLDANLADLINVLLMTEENGVHLKGASGNTATDQSGLWHLTYSPQQVFALHLKREESNSFLLTESELENFNQRFLYLTEHIRTQTSWPNNEQFMERSVCVRSGGLANGYCEEIILPFLPDITPSHLDTHWQRIAINRLNGLRASEATPADLIEERIVFLPPKSAQNWWTSNGFETVPDSVDTITTATSKLILKPFSSTTQRGQIPIEGWINPQGLNELEIAFGAGQFPNEWEILEIDPLLLNGQELESPPVILAVWNSNNLNGDYSIRARASYQDNYSETDTIKVLLDNQPPQFSITTQIEDDSVRIEIINVENDITRMDYSIDSMPLGIQTSSPFGFTLSLSMWVGGNLQATAYDAAGNSAEQSLMLGR